MICVETGAGFSPSLVQTFSSTSGSRSAKAPTAPLILPTATDSCAFLSRSRLRRISSNQSAKVNPNEVGSANLRRVFEFMRAAFQYVQQYVDLLQQNAAGIAEQKRIGRVNHVR